MHFNVPLGQEFQVLYFQGRYNKSRQTDVNGSHQLLAQVGIVWIGMIWNGIRMGLGMSMGNYCLTIILVLYFFFGNVTFLGLCKLRVDTMVTNDFQYTPYTVSTGLLQVLS